MDGDEDEMLEVQPKKARQHHSSAVVSGGSQAAPEPRGRLSTRTRLISL